MVDNEYVITYRPNEKHLGEPYAVHARYEVPRFISASPSNIYVLRRVDP